MSHFQGGFEEPNGQHVLFPWAAHPDGTGHICDGDVLSSHVDLEETKDNKSLAGANERPPDPANPPTPPPPPQILST